MRTKIATLVISALMLVAIVPAVSAGPFEEAQARYLYAKAELLELYSEWLSARADFLQVRARWRGDRTDQNLADLVQAGKEATLKGCDVVIKYCEMLRVQVEATRGLSDNEKAPLYDEIDGYISELQAKRVSVQNAGNAQELRTAAGELWRYWLQIRVRLKQITAQLIVAWADAVVQRLEAFVGRIEARIQQLKDNGIDTTSLEGWLDEFNSKIDSAKQRIADAENKVGQITDDITFIEIFGTAIREIREGVLYLRDALKRLRDIVSDMRSKGHTVTLSGSGTLIGHGDGRAYISGTGVVHVLAPIQGTMLVSPNANVTTVGEGTKTMLENGWVQYQGYGSGMVTGTDIVVDISGNGISILAAGTGTAVLTGTGWYRTYGENRYVYGTWTAAGATADLATGEVSAGVA